ncbi:MAG: translational GTPase TypA [Waddliaceae bacterium]|jgi:GTP-binding protein|nr:translational GTPase TypA [Waddliaceae bacterium]MBT3579023.1 translational GTPase TypA [Waddliaceae bacterium]MBT4445128.1 translational GTPase TypA [Waddliaceae bacterium]MBT6929165.1 translational GTPase TypA [Waddliaceae bacterium]MBT7264237.1 translational GTPase TypA [Waddliaceae bacterium]
MISPEKIRNIAIIAHIDHGKTTLLDAMLQYAHIFRDNEHVPTCVMDSYDQERERGITIFSKHTSVYYHDYKINIIDTPGHADFSGEVERVLGMVGCVLLLVDAQEGPMPQTRFVLSKALKMGLKPIVVLNKIDRPHADPDNALNLTFDLFHELDATDEQLDFKYCYASGINAFALKDLHDAPKDMGPLFDLVVESVEPPKGSMDDTFVMQSMTVAYDDFVGRQACGRIASGTVSKGDNVVLVNIEGKQKTYKITRIEGYLGLQRVEMEEAGVGDIVVISGVPDVMIGDTLSSPKNVVELPRPVLDEPTVSVDIMVNNSPFAGREGKHVTMNKIRERLEREKKSNVSLHIDASVAEKDAITVCGRGELHLSVLIEAMRREGYEMSISKPRVVIKDIEGVKHEPLERVHIEVPQEYSGAIIEEFSKKKGEMQALSTNEHGITSLEFLIPTRGLMGYRNEFLTATRGLGIMTAVFEKFTPWCGDIASRKNGVLIAMGPGRANAYSLFNLQSRGVMFCDATNEVYEGMVVGEHARDNDLVVNAIRGKQLTNVRASGTDEALTLTPPRDITLEYAIDFIEDDELVEVTPQSIRIRKRILTENERKRKR